MRFHGDGADADGCRGVARSAAPLHIAPATAPVRQPLTATGRAVFGVLIFVLTFGMAVMLGAADGSAQMRRDTLVLITASGERKIDIEVAETMEQKAMGLMFRTALADTAGMLFPYDPPQNITMWMKNTFIPLDMVFIRPDGIVHRIEARTTPHSERTIEAGAPCAAVLELAGGAAERLGLKAGDKVVHAHFQKPRK